MLVCLGDCVYITLSFTVLSSISHLHNYYEGYAEAVLMSGMDPNMASYPGSVGGENAHGPYTYIASAQCYLDTSLILTHPL